MGLSISSARAMFPHKIWEDLLKYTMDEWLIEREEDSNFDTKQYFAELFSIIKKVKYAEDLMFIRLNMLLRTSVPDVISINGKRIQKTLVQNYNHTPEYLSALKKQLIQWGEYITSNDKVYVEHDKMYESYKRETVLLSWLGYMVIYKSFKEESTDQMLLSYEKDPTHAGS